ncbi:non-ribosomal peptide synthetase [Burkholderia ubonensis]|uniref:L-cysteine--[L-cysteinyl-carrier protein] ligase n=1 Tax=Burkholderia ubonensis TaxID=101571 RepID=A0ABD4E9Y3_9BURK|nr:non-ribosomal peptide synthetase [Burkholderia ubonensis]KVN88985.1 hypothetical protein WJ68_05650 [Burkholderia ubonensis]
MTIDALLSRLAERGIHVEAVGDNLDIRAPRGTLTAELRAEIAAGKTALLARLRGTMAVRAEAAPQARHEPFPLTDIQQAYLSGREPHYELGGIGIYGYLEIDASGIDCARLERAWGRVVDRHDMLRCVALADGRQQVQPAGRTIPFTVVDLPETTPEHDAALDALRSDMLDRRFSGLEWPQFDIRVSRVNGRPSRLHVASDGLNIDLWSFSILVKDWVDLYRQPDVALPDLDISFRDYVIAFETYRQTPDYQRSVAHWLARAAELPPAPRLPYARPFGTVKGTDIRRRSFTLPAPAWRAFKARAAQAGVTPAAALMTAYAEVLALWSEEPRFTLNVTLFNRQPFHPQVDRLVGDFSSIMLLPFDAGALDSFAERARSAHDRLAEDLDRRSAGGLIAIREIARREHRPASALFPCVFTGTIGTTGYHELERLGPMLHQVTMTSQVALDEQVFETPAGLRVSWDAIENLFPPEMLDDMFEVHTDLLQRLAAAPAWAETNFPVQPPRRHGALIAAINDTSAPIPDLRIEQRLQEAVLAQPERRAVISLSGELSRSGLLARANALARTLHRFAANADRPVAVLLPSGPDQVVAVHAALLAGAPAMPLDWESPDLRILGMVRDAGAAAAVTDEAGALRRCWPDDIGLVLPDGTVSEPGSGVPDHAQTAYRATADDVACIIHTSGSTGTPKGVAVGHRSIVNRMTDMVTRFGLSADDISLGVTGLHHDMSLIDVIGLPAFAGGAVSVLAPGQRRDPGSWAARIARDRVTVWISVPTFLAMLVEHVEAQPAERHTDLQSLRLILLGGDFIPLDLPDRIRRLVPGVTLYSIGGPTETGIFDICHPIDKVDRTRRSIPYGKPLANTAYHVLDANLRPKPLFVPGEMVISGAGLAHGYWRDPQRSAEKFVVHPATGRRLYRSGDIGRWLPDGTLEILGRRDLQVKVGGHRIELADIEAALARHPAVSRAAAAVADGPGRSLIACVVPAADFWTRRVGPVVTEPQARARFKLEQPGLRRSDSSGAVALPAASAATRAQLQTRRSHRRFVADPIDLAALARTLEVLVAASGEGPLPRRRYGSAGGLYPIRVYLHAAGGRIAGLPGGLYYHDPIAHQLVPVDARDTLPAHMHAANNRSFAAESAFALFLVAHLPAIRPLYGQIARDLCLLEAGYIAQLLMDRCAGSTIGLCPLGLVDAGPLQEALGSPEDDEVLHCLVGGAIEPAWIAAPPPPSDTHAALAEDVKEYLRTVLPSHMVPEHIAVVDELPLNASGKIDRRLLSASRTVTRSGAAPATDTERKLAAIWQRLLDLTEVGPDDSFFRCGGDSLLATRLCTEVNRAFGVDMPVTTVFEAPTLAALAARVDSCAPTSVTTIPAADRTRPMPLFHSQRALWLHERLNPGQSAYNEPAGVHLTGRFDIDAIRQSMTTVMRRHEVLCHRFLEQDQEPVQVVDANACASLAIQSLDLRALDAPERQARIAAEMQAQSAPPFDLAKAPLLRVCAIRCADEDTLLLVVVHHIICDLWSLGVFATEIAEAYRAAIEKDAPRLAPLPLQYGDVAAWQRARPTDPAALAARKRRLDGIEALHLPTDFPRPAQPSFRGVRRSTTLSPASSAAVDALARRLDTSLFVVLAAAWAAVLSRHSGQVDFGIGMPVAGRDQPEFRPLIGFFASTLVLRADLRGNPGFETLARRMHTTVADALSHQHVPFEQLVGLFREWRDTSRNPLFQTLVVLQNEALIGASGPSLLKRSETDGGTEHFDLTLIGDRGSNGLSLTIRYATDLFAEATADRLLRHLLHMLETVALDIATPLGHLPLPGAAPLMGTPLTARSVQVEDVVARIRRHAEASPEAPAVIDARGAVALDYGSLDAASRRVAARLMRAGIGPEARVAVHMTRGPMAVVAALGVLRAGAVYVPVSAGQRTAHDVSAWGGATVLLSDQPEPPAAGVERIDPHDLPAPPDGLRDVTPVASATAYVIATSGVQGAPKPVEVDRGALSSYLPAIGHALCMTSTDVYLHTADFSFSSSIRQMLAPLVSGAAIAIAPSDLLIDAIGLFEHIGRTGVSVLDLVPSHLRACLDALAGMPADQRRALLDNRVRLLACASEALPPDLCRRWRELGGQAALLNMYGLTESGGIKLVSPAAAASAEHGPTMYIGRPLSGAWAVVCDHRLQPLAPGMIGEILLGGAGIARQYAGAPSLTAERFVPDPFSPSPGGRLLRTGDLGRLTGDGTLELVGRADAEVKIRGIRINLAALEAGVRTVPAVRDAIAVVDTHPDGYRQLRLVVQPEAGAAGPDAAQRITVGIRQMLPPAFKTAAIGFVDTLPRTRSGKISRSEIAGLSVTVPESRSDGGARNPAATLAAIWADLLHVPRVGDDDSFFELGGDSILVMRMVERGREAGIHIAPRDVMQHQTIAALIASQATSTASRADDRGPFSGPLGLLPAQLWFFERLPPNPHHWNLSVELDARETVAPQVLERALAALVAHHDALRVRFVRQAAGWQQICLPSDGSSKLHVADLSTVPADALERAVATHVERLKASLHLERGPVFAALLVNPGEALAQRLILTAHHLCVDAVSWHILVGDLNALCATAEDGDMQPLPPRSTGLHEWSLAATRLGCDATLPSRCSYWTELADIRTDIPQDRALPEDGDRHGDERRIEHTLTVAESDALGRLPRALGVSADDALLAALALAWPEWTGHALYVEIERHGRYEATDGIDLTRTVGWFTSAFPLLIRVSRPGDARHALETVSALTRRMQADGMAFDLARYLAAPQPVVDAVRALPVPAIRFNHLGRLDDIGHGGLFTWRDNRGLNDRPASAWRRNPLRLDVMTSGGHTHLIWSYSCRRHDARTVQALSNLFVTTLGRLLAVADRPGDDAAPPHPQRLPKDQLDDILSELNEAQARP